MKIVNVIAVMSTLLLCSCVVKPQKQTNYDDKCHIDTRKYTLTVDQLDIFDGMNCQNDDCKEEFISQVVSAAMLLPVSAVVSGSVAVAGNTLYWLEESGHCQPGKPVVIPRSGPKVEETIIR